MCIAILNKTGILKRETLETCAIKNSDGGGISWIEDGKLKIFKSLKSDDVINMYFKVREENNFPMMIHFRIGTSGLLNECNCHPFFVNENLSMCHNGVIFNMAKSDKESDTAYFVQNILKEIPEDFIYNNVILKLLEKYLGEYNKIIFLNNKGEYFILHEKEGHWDEKKENWYSNYSYVNYTKYTKPHSEGFGISNNYSEDKFKNYNKFSSPVSSYDRDCETCKKPHCNFCDDVNYDEQGNFKGNVQNFTKVTGSQVYCDKNCYSCEELTICKICDICEKPNCSNCLFFKAIMKDVD